MPRLSPFVKYEVTMLYNVGSEEKPKYVPINVCGVVQDNPGKMSSIFRQNPELLKCSAISFESYTPIYC